MNVYIFQAAMYCEACGEDVKTTLAKPTVYDSANESTWDSDEYPKGPYSDGGGESDTPSHCDSCHEFLENPLTEAGYAYVRGLLAEHKESGRGNAEVLNLWREFYEIETEEEFER